MSDSGNRAEQGRADDVAGSREREPLCSNRAVDEATDDALGDGEHGDEGAADGETAAGDAAERDLVAEMAALQDQFLRKQSDFENFRRRLHRDKDEAIRYANTQVLLDLADVIDGLERAIQTGEDADVESLREGVSLIEKQLTGLLERKWGFCRFSSEGQPFDPERHQAIASEESDVYEVATVVEDYQRGYLLHERVVRPARVKVAQPQSGSNEDPAGARGDASADTKEGE